MTVTQLDAALADALGVLAREYDTEVWAGFMPRRLEQRPPQVGLIYRLMAGGGDRTVDGISHPDGWDFEVTVFARGRRTALEVAAKTARRLESEGWFVRWREEGYITKTNRRTFNLVATGA